VLLLNVAFTLNPTQQVLRPCLLSPLCGSIAKQVTKRDDYMSEELGIPTETPTTEDNGTGTKSDGGGPAPTREDTGAVDPSKGGGDAPK
jgi:hypothetical protein